MVSLRLHFTRLLENIQPPSKRLEAARTLPPKVRDYLEAHDGLITLDPHTRLAGSYAQFLSAGDVKDVDFLVRTSGHPQKNDPEAKCIVAALKSALDGLPAHLALQGYVEVEVSGARRSVHVCFPQEDFHIDAVPCIAPHGFASSIWVPDKGFNKWVESHPIGVVNLVKELEDAHPDRFRTLVKMSKYFRNVQMQRRRPKSYWLLTLLIQEFRDFGFTASDPLGESFYSLLDRLYNRLAPTFGRTDGATPNLKDPMLGHNVSWNWGRGDFETFMRRLDDGRRWSQNALRAAARDDLDDAVRQWQRVFGLAFPSEVSDLARAEAATMQPGRAAVAASGLILPGPARGTLPVPPTKYYGDPIA